MISLGNTAQQDERRCIDAWTSTSGADRLEGKASATLRHSEGAAQPLVFPIGAAGVAIGRVRVVIRDEVGAFVATMSIASLAGSQNILWTPRAGLSPGAYAAYWEGRKAD